MERYHVRVRGPVVDGLIRVLDCHQPAHGLCNIVPFLAEASRLDKRDADRYMASVPLIARSRREVQTV
jgi:hypothetical protein